MKNPHVIAERRNARFLIKRQNNFGRSVGTKTSAAVNTLRPELIDNVLV